MSADVTSKSTREPRELCVLMPCRVKLRDGIAGEQIQVLAYNFNRADGYDITGLRCIDCRQEWEISIGNDYKGRACPNCYSDNVEAVSVRLIYSNWGPHNGGIKELAARALVAVNNGGRLLEQDRLERFLEAANG